MVAAKKARLPPQMSPRYEHVFPVLVIFICAMKQPDSRPTYSDVAAVTSDVFISLGEIVSFRSTKHRACDPASMSDEQN